MLSLNLGGRLETLELYFQDIHYSIPSIEDFSLIHGTQLAGSMSSNVVSATCITNFEFIPQRYANAETCAEMYQYMTKKYTSINKIEYDGRALPWRDEIQQKYVYLNGILDFFQMIGSKQSKLFLYRLPNDVDASRALDSGHSQIKELHLIECANKTIFQYLIQSKQSEYVESLYIQDTIVDFIGPLKNMVTLTSLHIDYVELEFAQVPLDEVFDGCPPSLKSLIIPYGMLYAAMSNKQLESIEYLDLGWVNITSSVGYIISNCLPNLIDLKLYGGVTENVHIVLKNPQLRTAKIVLRDFDDHGYDFEDELEDAYYKYVFSFKCPTITESQYYICYRMNVTLADSGDIQGLPLLSVESFTERKLRVGYPMHIH